MHGTLLTIMLWLAVLGCALMAGLYFAFSAFIMRALGRIDRDAGIAAMNAINVDIQRSLFMPVFLGSTVIAAILAGLAAFDRQAPHAWPTLIGGTLYVLGMFGVTVVRNVPLNTALEAARGSDRAALWTRYLGQWTRWNHVRTVASLAGCGLFVRAISLL